MPADSRATIHLLFFVRISVQKKKSLTGKGKESRPGPVENAD